MIRVDVRSRNIGSTRILGGISFELQRGETLAISGPSGVGKTTLLRIIAGLDKDYCGSVQGAGRVAMVFQEPVLLPWRDVLSNITLVNSSDEHTARAVLEEVGLASLTRQFPGQLSLGQQRRLALARAFSANPDLLLLDEPFVSLDPDLVNEMLTLTESLLAARRMATILVTHDRAESSRLASRIAELRGDPATLRFA